MTPTLPQISSALQSILQRACPTIQVSILSNHDVGITQAGYYLGISAGNEVEANRIQAIMESLSNLNMTFIGHREKDGLNVMVYFLPYDPT